MKVKVFLTVLAIGILSFGPVRSSRADGTPTAGSTAEATAVQTSVITEEATPVETPAPHKHHKRKKVDLEAAATPSVTEVPFQSPTVSPSVSPSPEAKVEEENYQLNPLVITGTKAKLKVYDEPAEVSVVSKEDIDNKIVVYLDDALQDVPGVAVSRVAAGGQSVTLTMRGIPGYAENLVQLDGFALNQPNNGRVFFNMVPTQLVDHVEVVEGPFSSLYGKEALGGVVNIITKEPVGETFSLSEDWDSTNTRVTDFNFQDKVDKAWSFYLGYENTTVAGYTDHQFAQVSPLATPLPGYTGTYTPVTGFSQTTSNKGATEYNVGEIARTVLENDIFTAKIYFRPAPGQTLSLLVDYSYWDQPTTDQDGELGNTWLSANGTQFAGGALGAGAVTYVNSGTGKTTVTGAPVSFSGTGQLGVLNQYQYLTAPGNNSFQPTNLRYEGKIDNDLTLYGSFTFWTHFNLLQGTLSVADSPLSGPSTEQISSNWEALGTIDADLRLDNHDLIVGIGEDNAFVNNINAFVPFWGTDSVYTDIANSTSQVNELYQSLFAQDEWRVTPSLTAFLGARLDDWQESQLEIYSAVAGAGLIAGENNYPTNDILNFSPKLSLVYKFGEDASIRASVGQSFNPPVPSDLTAGGVSGSTTTIPNPTLQPEQDTAWEVGGELNLSTSTTITVTYFENYLTNLIYENSTSGTNGTTTDEYFNAGSVFDPGFEVDVKQKVFSFLTLDVNNTYVNPTFTSNPAVPGSQGNLVPYISQEIGNAAADFDWKKFTLEISGTTHSKEYTTATNTDTVNGVQGSWDPYTTFNFKTSYHFANGSIFFGVDNFTNQRYYQIYENVGTVFGVGAHLFI